jgi:hypothetical protein
MTQKNICSQKKVAHEQEGIKINNAMRKKKKTHATKMQNPYAFTTSQTMHMFY